MKKLTKRQIAYFVKDEHKAAAEYRKLGLGFLAKDEAKHAAFFRMLRAKKR